MDKWEAVFFSILVLSIATCTVTDNYTQIRKLEIRAAIAEVK